MLTLHAEVLNKLAPCCVFSVGEEDDSDDQEEGGEAVPSSGEDMSPSQFSSSTLKSLAARAQQPTAQPAGLAGSGIGQPVGAGAAAPGASSSSSAPAEDFRSAALRGLTERTKQAVDEQSKFSRGEGTGQQQQQRQPGGGGGGGFPFGDILGALGGEAGAGGGGGGEGGMGFMVDYIMQNLLSKEVLYTPLKVRTGWLLVLKESCHAPDGKFSCLGK